MVRNFYWIASFGLIATLGCMENPRDLPSKPVTTDDVGRDARKAADTGLQYSLQAKDELVAALEAQRKDLEGKIAELREKGSELKDEAKTNWEKKMSELDTKRTAANAKLAELGNATAGAWEEMQKGAKSAWDELNKAYQEAAKEFDPDTN